MAIGLLSGWIARRVIDYRLSLWACLCLGVLGAWAGSLMAGIIGLDLSGPLGVLALSVTGSVLLLALFVLLSRR